MSQAHIHSIRKVFPNENGISYKQVGLFVSLIDLHNFSNHLPKFREVQALHNCALQTPWTFNPCNIEIRDNNAVLKDMKALAISKATKHFHIIVV